MFFTYIFNILVYYGMKGKFVYSSIFSLIIAISLIIRKNWNQISSKKNIDVVVDVVVAVAFGESVRVQQESTF